MQGLKLLTEVTQNIELLTEEQNGKSFTYITGPFIECNVVNRNHRWYDLQTVLPEINRYITEMVGNGRRSW